MPTGYTYPVQKGELTEFRDFAMRCSRAFMPLISMRDEPMDAPIPEEFKPDTGYYDNRIAELEAELAQLTAMTIDQCTAAQHAARDQVQQQNEKWAVERADDRKKYEAMLAKVQAWQPPTSDHIEMKSFMVEQLRMSIDRECSDIAMPLPELVHPAEWRDKRIKAVSESLGRSQADRAKAIARARESTEWVAALRASLA